MKSGCPGKRVLPAYQIIGGDLGGGAWGGASRPWGRGIKWSLSVRRGRCDGAGAGGIGSKGRLKKQQQPRLLKTTEILVCQASAWNRVTIVVFS